MYGEDIDPSKASFTFYRGDNDDDLPVEDYNFQIYVTDLEDPSNDNIRDIAHPDWEFLWGNEMENVFSPNDQTEVYTSTNGRLNALDTVDKARKWLTDIGMVEEEAKKGAW